MAEIKFKGDPCSTKGELPKTGDTLPNVTLCKQDLSEVTLNSYKGKMVILNVFPSIDTSVCAASVRHFNECAASIQGVEVLCVSRDLPFAMGRFCAAENLKHVTSLSDFRDGSFGRLLGLEIADGPLKGLLARAVLILNTEGKLIYTELVDDIVHEPDYESALKTVEL